jgi:uncharacterized membrane protein YcaP (DUF421 family)
VPGWVLIVLRSLGAVVLLFVITRILGKKQISQLTFLEFVTGITLGELAGFISTDMESHYLYGVLALLVWFLVPFGLEMLTLKSRWVRKVFTGKGTVLIKDGKVLEDNMKKERFTTDDLLEVLRKKNVFKVADVEFAVLESSGDVNILLTKENRPLTAKDLKIKTAREPEPQTVIVDGEILDEPLATAGLSREWLDTELKKMKMTKENVFIGQVDGYGQFYVDTYDDKKKPPQPQNKKVLMATLKKCEADLELFSLTTEIQEAKKMYNECANKLNAVIKSVTPMLDS